ncbi:ROK family protein [Sphingobacterium rhinopitheci]|uniref:ROK family protein n=1 Tax=Sphingobacterium rhinopitheci TaxID=2781960 RepID=UPI001F521742|nr:ROK family protein [Sphingobacterium rhinopitheci]MCI0919946.1 ROK family protein [Sphingobacterium rhinopitheci]
MMTKKRTLCIDIGGTHIAAAVIDEGTISLYNNAQVHAVVDSNAGREAILKQWDDAIAAVLQKCKFAIDNIVISIPGPFDYDNGICLMDGMHKYQSLLHMDVKSWFAHMYSIDVQCIHFYNDAVAFLLGELYFSQLFDKKVVGLTLGTGLGSAFYNSNNAVDLNYGSAKFRDGIAEDYISTRGILDFVEQRYQIKYTNVKAIVDDNLEVVCSEAFSYLADSLADFIHQYIDKLEPDTIIIGGSIAKAHALFLNRLQQKVKIPIKVASMDDFNIFCGMTSINI